MMASSAAATRRVLAAAVLVLGSLCAATADDLPRTAGPYVPTPQPIVDRMLQMAHVGRKDFVVDLGSGDGRIVRTAAKEYGASGFGVDIDADLVDRSNAAAREEGIAARAVFHLQDVFQADIRNATVVTLYVLPEMMVGLRPKMLSELKPGTRIVSHDYHFREWRPDAQVSFDVPEKKSAVGFSSASVFLWIVPAHVAGRWQLEVSGSKLAAPVTLALDQLFQNVMGGAQVGKRTTDVTAITLRGDMIEFALDTDPRPGGSRHTFRGKVAGVTMEGQVAWGSGPLSKRYHWKASRIEPPRESLAR